MRDLATGEVRVLSKDCLAFGNLLPNEYEKRKTAMTKFV